MAIYRVGEGYSSDMNAFDVSVLFLGTPVAASRKMFVLDFVDGVIDFRGTDFRYGADGVPKAGVVEGYAIYNSEGARAISFGGFEGGVKQFVSAASTISTTDDAQLMTHLLSGKDRIYGDDLADRLVGFADKDSLFGAGGADVLIGGRGQDKFVYKAANESTAEEMDLIADFRHGDRVVLSGLAEFEFIGQATFTGGAQVAYATQDGYAFVIADSDGDMETDLVIALEGIFTLTEADFML